MGAFDAFDAKVDKAVADAESAGTAMTKTAQEISDLLDYDVGTFTEWQSIDMGDAFPDAIASAVDALKSAFEAVKTLLNTLKAVWEIIKIFALGLASILAAALEAARVVVSNVIESLEEGGFYVRWGPIPSSFWMGNLNHPTQWINNTFNSMSDPTDRDRPDFATAQGQAGFMVMAIAPDINQIRELMNKLLELIFGIKPLDWDLNTEGLLQENYTGNKYRGQGKAPNWVNLTMPEMIPPITNVVNILKQALNYLVFGSALADIIQKYIDYLDKKINEIEKLILKLTELVELFTALLAIGPLHAIGWSGNFTTADLKSVSGTIGLPEGVDGNDQALVATGFTVMGAGVPAAAWAVMSGLFGLGVTE